MFLSIETLEELLSTSIGTLENDVKENVEKLVPWDFAWRKIRCKYFSHAQVTPQIHTCIIKLTNIWQNLNEHATKIDLRFFAYFFLGVELSNWSENLNVRNLSFPRKVLQLTISYDLLDFLKFWVFVECINYAAEHVEDSGSMSSEAWSSLNYTKVKTALEFCLYKIHFRKFLKHHLSMTHVNNLHSLSVLPRACPWMLWTSAGSRESARGKCKKWIQPNQKSVNESKQQHIQFIFS